MKWCKYHPCIHFSEINSPHHSRKASNSKRCDTSLVVRVLGRLCNLPSFRAPKSTLKHSKSISIFPLLVRSNCLEAIATLETDSFCFALFRSCKETRRLCYRLKEDMSQVRVIFSLIIFLHGESLTFFFMTRFSGMVYHDGHTARSRAWTKQLLLWRLPR